MSKLSNIRVYVEDGLLKIEVELSGCKKLLDIIMDNVDNKPEAREEEPTREEEPDDGPTGVDAEDIADSKLPESEGVDLFEVGPTGVGGELQDAGDGRKKIEEIRAWLKDNKFNYRNFCKFLYTREYLAGFRLSRPLIGTTAKGEPSLFKLATRYYTYWKTACDKEAYLYKQFLEEQLEDLGVKIEMVKDILDGEEIDPDNLPEGIEVAT